MGVCVCDHVILVQYYLIFLIFNYIEDYYDWGGEGNEIGDNVVLGIEGIEEIERRLYLQALKVVEVKVLL